MAKPPPPPQHSLNTAHGSAAAGSGASGLSPSAGLSGPSGTGSQQFGMSGLTGPSGTGSRGGAPQLRETFAADELAIVLSHYDLGVIEAIKDFPRGSRKAPKLILRADNGLYLLKRRARGKDDPFKVAYAHSIQLYLADRKFPLPKLVGTRRDHNSLLQWKGNIYELFEYVRGTSYDNSVEATADAGRVLALFHRLLKEFHPEYEPPVGSYHASRSVNAAFDNIPRTLARIDPQRSDQEQQQIGDLVAFLQTAYQQAAARVNDLGLPDWPMQIVHSDWHPGNMLFRGPKVVAVIDYDTTRQQQRVTDIANGALQFSILGGGDDPERWPDHLDRARFQRFLEAYDAVPNCVISRAELRTIPWLMIEALIAESVIPIAHTGSFARLEGLGFLRMVERKVRWLQEHAEPLVKVLEG